MNKKRVISYVMAAALLVGGTFAGTKALFTDSVDAIGEVTISTGDVDLAITSEKNEWTLNRNGDEDGKGTNASENIFNNLKTGDVLTKQIEVTNNGTLVAEVELVRNEIQDAVLNGKMDYTATVTNKDGKVSNTEKMIMQPGEKITIDLMLKVTGGGKHNDEGSLNHDDQEGKAINLSNLYQLNATQQNPKGVK